MGLWLTVHSYSNVFLYRYLKDKNRKLHDSKAFFFGLIQRTETLCSMQPFRNVKTIFKYCMSGVYKHAASEGLYRLAVVLRPFRA